MQTPARVHAPAQVQPPAQVPTTVHATIQVQASVQVPTAAQATAQAQVQEPQANNHPLMTQEGYQDILEYLYDAERVINEMKENRGDRVGSSLPNTTFGGQQIGAPTGSSVQVTPQAQSEMAASQTQGSTAGQEVPDQATAQGMNQPNRPTRLSRPPPPTPTPNQLGENVHMTSALRGREGVTQNLTKGPKEWIWYDYGQREGGGPKSRE